MTQTETCPRCGYDAELTDTRTERHGVIIDVEAYSCEACGLDFEQRV